MKGSVGESLCILRMGNIPNCENPGAIKEKYRKFKLHQDLGSESRGTPHICTKLGTSLQLVLEAKGYLFYYKERIWELHRWCSSWQHVLLQRTQSGSRCTYRAAHSFL